MRILSTIFLLSFMFNSWAQQFGSIEGKAVDAENKMYFRDVEIFRLEEDRVLISGGLLAGEYICTSPIQAVVNGMSVQPVIENI